MSIAQLLQAAEFLERKDRGTYHYIDLIFTYIHFIISVFSVCHTCLIYRRCHAYVNKYIMLKTAKISYVLERSRIYVYEDRNLEKIVFKKKKDHRSLHFFNSICDRNFSFRFSLYV